jgi:hypothetical protein
MGREWQFQLRLQLSGELAAALHGDPDHGAHPALAEILRRHQASLQCQYDALAAYISRALREGVGRYPLYTWTRDTLEHPVKRQKYMRTFTVRAHGLDKYPQSIADPLYAELSSLAGDAGIEGITRIDTNPLNKPQSRSQSRARGEART